MLCSCRSLPCYSLWSAARRSTLVVAFHFASISNKYPQALEMAEQSRQASMAGGLPTLCLAVIASEVKSSSPSSPCQDEKRGGGVGE